MTSSHEPTTTLYAGQFLRLARRGRWEYVTRPGTTGVVVIVALHEDGRVVLVEQYRPPVDARVIELPAGLAGDTGEAETLLEAARRELHEETGYIAQEWTRLSTNFGSAGLTDETITFFRATGLEKVGPGGGDDSESIEVHEVALEDLPRWLSSAEASGTKADVKLMAGIFAATQGLW